MLKFFRRRSPVRHVQQLSREDIAELLVLRWHGYTPEQWAGLPALVRVDKRESFYQAQGLGA